MTTQTALKTTAAVLILAAIPTAVLLSRKDDPVSISRKSSASGSMADPASTRDLPIPSGSESTRRVQARPDRSSASKADNQGPVPGMVRLGDIDWEGAAHKHSERLAGRLTARLSLTPEQQAKLNAYLVEKDRKESETLKKQTSGGTLTIAGTPGSTALPAQMFQIVSTKSDRDFDNFLNGMLTPEQKSINDTFREQEHQEAVRKDAQSEIDNLSEYVDLSPEQKQQLFDQAEHRSQGQVVTSSDEAPLSAEDEARQILTPGQLAVYDQGKAEDSQPSKGKYDTITIMRSVPDDEPGK